MLRHLYVKFRNAKRRIVFIIELFKKPLDSELPFTISMLKSLVSFNPIGVIHVGGHLGQEIPLYRYLRLKKINIFEPQLQLASSLAKKYKYCREVIIHQYGLGQKSEIKPMYLESDDSPNCSASSSFLRPKSHLSDYPHVKFHEMSKGKFRVKTLDSFKIVDCDFLVIDTQGFELEVLIGAEATLNYIDYIVCEYWQNDAYEGVPSFSEITSFLEARGFSLRIQTYDRTMGNLFFSRRF